MTYMSKAQLPIVGIECCRARAWNARCLQRPRRPSDPKSLLKLLRNPPAMHRWQRGFGPPVGAAARPSVWRDLNPREQVAVQEQEQEQGQVQGE